jgi:hypothetical protein
MKLTSLSAAAGKLRFLLVDESMSTLALASSALRRIMKSSRRADALKSRMEYEIQK